MPPHRVGVPSGEGTDERRVGLSAGHSEEAEGGEDRVATPGADAFQARNCAAASRRRGHGQEPAKTEKPKKEEKEKGWTTVERIRRKGVRKAEIVNVMGSPRETWGKLTRGRQ